MWIESLENGLKNQKGTVHLKCNSDFCCLVTVYSVKETGKLSLVHLYS